MKIEGEISTTTENTENFVQYLLKERTSLARTPTTLKMEGEMEKITEMRAKYVPFAFEARPPLLKK